MGSCGCARTGFGRPGSMRSWLSVVLGLQRAGAQTVRPAARSVVRGHGSRARVDASRASIISSICAVTMKSAKLRAPRSRQRARQRSAASSRSLLDENTVATPWRAWGQERHGRARRRCGVRTKVQCDDGQRSGTRAMWSRVALELQ